MEAAGWVCLYLLCLQGSLLQLTHGTDCSGTTQGEDCVRPTTLGKNEVSVRLRPSVPKKSRDPTKTQRGNPGAYSAIGMSTDDNESSDMLLDRQKRQLGKHDSLPGSVSAKGFPNTLIQVQADRARRHLGQSGTKKKNKWKSRVGSFSLLSNNNPSASLQVTRVRRQVQKDKNRNSRKRPGMYTLLGEPEKQPPIKPAPLGQRRKRSAQKKKQTKRMFCS
ncbi:uncharacterized protein LOC105027372 [Esox lucius]|uniref:uncharacterized protein LOC105027372 n=1 Tax=Esox lucius TaxID=8010 RepID=UPI0005761B55|nr:uncharacterized protein LOC105027372 [Esox lucius]